VEWLQQQELLARWTIQGAPITALGYTSLPQKGSVPKLFAGFDRFPIGQRVFLSGNKQYDPVKLGLNTDT